MTKKRNLKTCLDEIQLYKLMKLLILISTKWKNIPSVISRTSMRKQVSKAALNQ